MSVTIGVIRVLTQEDHQATAAHGQIIEDNYSSVTTISRCIDDHPDGIPSPDAEIKAIPHIESLARELTPDVDVLAISCALDPAVESLQAELPIPVLGAGRCVAATAMALGSRIGTLSLEEGVPPVVLDFLGDSHHTSRQVTGAETTNFLTSEEGRSAIKKEVRGLLKNGSDVIAPVCTGITTSGVLPELARETEVPIVDPVVSMGSIATLISSTS